SPDGQVLAAGGGGARGLIPRNVLLWSPASGKQLETISTSAEKAEIRSLAFSADSKLLAWADGTSRSPVRFWSLVSATELEYPGLTGTCAEVVALSPDGGTLVAGDSGNTIHLWEFPQGKERPTSSKHGGRITGPVF